MIDTEKIISIKKANLKKISILGGKALSLAKMKQAKFNVPDAFVVSTEANNEFILSNEEKILKKFDALKTNFVSVRSSANIEDSLTNSFAGQFDTFLNVSRQSLIKKIIACKNFKQNNRVKEYCKINNLEPTKIKMAVIVQKMIDSDFSGVAFTKNPVTNNKNEIIIESVFGLGESIVSGKVTPNRYVYDKKLKKITKINLEKQEKMLIRGSSKKNEWKKITQKIQAKQISVAQIESLTREVLKIENFLKKQPVDVEWAIKDNRIFILQARPITT